ncbi:aspartate/glutamate racemase family protein [Bythopirellula polymerisocia]|uniref:Asp/Glu/Hydantoin racemase n=1 Tax=Bythopirellula polymerisocia TaxID=2528003 RepID=A0A5C6CV59_9BACT|nr:aspartate/glutamate racemase family protein [Bythopirellula polymerisocia]TWU27705.1 Asp/Glu/Hydantoin racemase [Bythopirellula polymerisocia]
MNRKTLALVHTSSTLAPVFERLCKEKLLDVDLLHIEDASLIRDVIADGELTADTLERVLHHLTTAEDTVADYIMVTCSSIGPAVDAAQSRLHKPVLRVDQPLAEAAVKIGTNIGVIATLSTTLVPTVDLIRRHAVKVGKEVNIVSELCAGAFEAFLADDLESHDAAVMEAIERLAPTVDVIVLAQASMARVMSDFKGDEIKTPILSSPSLAVDYLATVL